MIKVIELFAGIGSQTQALKNQNIEHDIIGISEWSINSIISYGELHCSNKPDYNLSKEEILEKLKDVTFSLDTKTPYNLKKLKESKLKLLYKHHKNSKNLGSITDMSGNDINNCNLLTYSFPCQDLSILGKKKGLYDGKSSSLLWEVKRLLDETKKMPEYLLMENVNSILNKTHKKGFDEWKIFLSNKGYYNYVLLLKASDYGIPQNRDRAYMISSLYNLKDIKERIISQAKRTKLRIKDILDGEHREMTNLYNYLPEKIEYKHTKDDVEFSNLVNYSTFKIENRFHSIDSIAPTITANGAYSRIKIYDKAKLFLLNELEHWKLMGFTKEHFDIVQKIQGKTELKKQAGNSIVVNVLEVIFKEMFKND